MPIHDHGYARYQGTRTPPGRAWAVIAGAGIRGMLSARPFLLVLLFAWLQFFVRAVMLYLAANVPQADVIAPSPATFASSSTGRGSSSSSWRSMPAPGS